MMTESMLLPARECLDAMLEDMAQTIPYSIPAIETSQHSMNIGLGLGTASIGLALQLFPQIAYHTSAILTGGLSLNNLWTYGDALLSLGAMGFGLGLTAYSLAMVVRGLSMNLYNYAQSYSLSKEIRKMRPINSQEEFRRVLSHADSLSGKVCFMNGVQLSSLPRYLPNQKDGITHIQRAEFGNIPFSIFLTDSQSLDMLFYQNEEIAFVGNLQHNPKTRNTHFNYMACHNAYSV